MVSHPLWWQLSVNCRFSPCLHWWYIHD